MPCQNSAVSGSMPASHSRRCTTMYVRDQRVAADMVEIEMRIDDKIDARRVAADRFEPHPTQRLLADGPRVSIRPWVEECYSRPDEVINVARRDT